jgi:hypothetical protein
VTFSNIPQTGYTDLKIVMPLRSANNNTYNYVSIAFNGVTTDQTSRTLGGGDNSSLQSGTQSNLQFISTGNSATSNTFGNHELYIPNYTSSNLKSALLETVNENNSAASGAVYLTLHSLLWSSTAAITSVTITGVTGSFVAGSSFSLYGIAAQGTTPTVLPKASGGDIITNDGTYWIHTFLSSGVFTPNQALNTDFLVIAGGGGGAAISSGGAYGAPGGGAGGYRTSVGTSGRNSSAETPLTLASNTNYAVTVGAGGAGNTVGSNSVFSTITSLGGGAMVGGSAANGGSGGGSFDFAPQNVPGPGTANQGFGGGAGSATTSPGGGGGAGGAGSTVRQGGVGITSSISGSSVGRAGGGGGGYTSSSNATDGGGSGGLSASNNGSNATINTGGGGGGGAANGTTTSGGSGASGIVIVRYTMA